jgi:hypothetical protein
MILSRVPVQLFRISCSVLLQRGSRNFASLRASPFASGEGNFPAKLSSHDGKSPVGSFL